ncbi:phosphoribosylformylglycinamidine cyclo-ligase [Pseudomonadota bacterium]
MATYKQSGVDIDMGDKCSAIAYAAAKKTFAARKGMIGRPVTINGGFTGLMDFGDFYLVKNDDGVGSKIAIADALGKHDTLGYDLLAMVADDAVCVGAETVAITNTLDTSKVSDKVVEPLLRGLQKACKEQKVVIPGGEIAEMPDLINGNVWNASALGILEKKKFIKGDKVKPGDNIIGLKSHGFRSNGFSLIRFILREAYGYNWFSKKYDGKKSWGEVTLTPSLIYSDAVLDLIGRYKKKAKVKVKAIVHVTGGGIPGNITRISGGHGAYLNDLFKPHDPMLKLQELGNVSDIEAYKVWNMGVGMILISKDFKKIKSILKKHKIEAKIIGEVTKEKKVRIVSRGAHSNDKILTF